MKFLILILFLLLVGTLQATERWVSVTGSGSADGSTEANAMVYATFVDWIGTGGSVNAAAGDIFNIKVGTYARAGTTDIWANSGSVTSPIKVRGYRTTPGDGYQGRANGGTGDLDTNNMPLISTTTGLLSITDTYLIVESIQFHSTRTGAAVSVTAGTDDIFAFCKFTADNTAAGCIALSHAQVRGTVYSCDIALLAASGGNSALTLSGTAGRVFNSRITGKTAPGILSANSSQIMNCVVYNSTVGISHTPPTSGTVISNCTITGNSSDGIDIVTASTAISVFCNNMITDNGGYGIDFNSTVPSFTFGNRTRNNFLGPTNLSTDWLAATNYGAVTTPGAAATDYTDAGTFDYRLITGSPGKGAGLPPFMSMGAFQVQAASGQTSTASIK